MRTGPTLGLRLSRTIIFLFSLLILIFTSSHAQPPPYRLFLPLILTPSSALLPNGDFETQDPVEWDQVPADGSIITSRLPEGVTPHSGEWVAWLGDHGEKNLSNLNEISQTLAVPGFAPILRFWKRIQSNEDCGLTQDQLIVRVKTAGGQDGEVVHMGALCKDKSTSTWSPEIVDLRKYAGQMITLRVQVITANPAGLPPISEIFLDDFTFSPN